jgi:CcmD family protein
MSVYLVAAYAVFWALTFVLVVSIWARQRRLEREIKALETQLGIAEATDSE